MKLTMDQAKALFRDGNRMGRGYEPDATSIQDVVDDLVRSRQGEVILPRQRSGEVALVRCGNGEVVAVGGDHQGLMAWCVTIQEPSEGGSE